MRVLIYKCEDELAPIGGPAGYLYNIKQYRDDKNDNEILFKNSKWRFQKNILEKIVSRLKYPWSEQARNLFAIFHRENYGSVNNFDGFDLVHFHTTHELYLERHNLDKYEGKVILTSHSPKVAYKEIIEDVVPKKEYVKYQKIFDKAEEIDEYAFKRADYIIFPCPGAEEPYYHSWPKYAELRDSLKIRYVPTGILSVHCERGRETIRNELGIPNEAFVLSFVGRHNEVKGYDILQKIFYGLQNVYVICCGRQGAIEPPKSNRWIEIGWTTDPYSYVAASDVYMLPNRETYFDIAMLQTLSIGKCSVVSNTGGNKEFLGVPGVKLYNTVDEAIGLCKEFLNMTSKERAEIENNQRLIFNEKYTIESFYTEYKRVLRNIVEDKNE